MDLKHNYFQVQDTIPTKKTGINTISKSELNTGLIIERNTIEMVSLRSLSVDSTRLTQPKKTRPIIKTVPFIPENDTVQHPTFNVLNNNFIFPDEYSFFDQLNFIPYKPLLKREEFTPKQTKLHTKEEFDNRGTKTTQPEQVFFSREDDVTPSGFLSTDWMLGVIIFSLILFGWLRVGFSRFFQTAIQASYNYFTARRIFEEANITRSRVFYFMNFLFFINIALFITQFMEYQHFTIYKLNGILLFFIIFVLVILMYLVKAFFLYLFDFVFLTHRCFTSYNFTVFLYNKMIGFLLLPIISILPFVPQHVTLWLFLSGRLDFPINIR